MWSVLSVLFAALACVGCGDGESPAPERGKPASPTGNGAGPYEEVDGGSDRPLRLADCEAFPPEALESWSSGQPGTFITTGRPRGYLYTRERFSDFTLTLEYRFVRPETVREEADLDDRNTGILIYVPEEHGIWPRSLEVQGRHDQMAGIKSNAPDLQVVVTRDDESLRQLARRPVGEWNRIRIESRGGRLQTWLNGVKIAETLPGELRAGHIGFQSEGHEVHFRDVGISVP
jgi:hypothetical protein